MVAKKEAASRNCCLFSLLLVISVLVLTQTVSGIISYNCHLLNKLANEGTKDNGKHQHNVGKSSMKSYSKDNVYNAPMSNGNDRMFGLSTGNSRKNRLMKNNSEEVRKSDILLNLLKELEIEYQRLVDGSNDGNGKILKSEIFLEKIPLLNWNEAKSIRTKKMKSLRSKRDLDSSLVPINVNYYDYLEIEVPPLKVPYDYYETEVSAIVSNTDKSIETSKSKVNTDIFDVAYKIKYFLDKMKPGIHKEMDNAIQSLLSKLPSCLKSIITEEAVCFRNRMYNEYIYADNNILLNSKNLRYVKSYPKIVHGKSEFSFKRLYGDVYHIRNTYYNEYLYASLIPDDDESRYVFTWPNATMAWQLIVDNMKWCSLKSILWDELLYLKGGKHDNTRHVFTFQPKAKTKPGKQFEWIIEPCYS